MLTDSLYVVANRLYEKLEAAKRDLGIAAVFYGDQDRLPVTPVVCVEPDNKLRTLVGAQRQTEQTLQVFLLVYHGSVTSPQLNRREADQSAEAIETFIHQDPYLTVDGERLVIHGMITRIESGYSRRNQDVFRASRMTYEAISKVRLPG